MQDKKEWNKFYDVFVSTLLAFVAFWAYDSLKVFAISSWKLNETYAVAVAGAIMCRLLIYPIILMSCMFDDECLDSPKVPNKLITPTCQLPLF